LGGAYLKVVMSNTDFKFTETCGSYSNVCAATGADANCHNATLSDGACTISEDKTSLTFEHKNSIVKPVVNNV
jgi:hypothetical protein